MNGKFILQLLHFRNKKLKTKKLPRLAQDHKMNPRSQKVAPPSCFSASGFHSHPASKKNKVPGSGARRLTRHCASSMRQGIGTRTRHFTVIFSQLRDGVQEAKHVLASLSIKFTLRCCFNMTCIPENRDVIQLKQ